MRLITLFTCLLVVTSLSLHAEISLSRVNGCLCEGQPTQAFELTATGTAGPFTFEWSGPSGFTSTDQNPLISEAGQYSVTITNIYGCSMTLYDNLPACPGIQSLDFEVQPDCGGQGGNILTTVTGGAPGYLNYEWSNGQYIPDIYNVPAGMYTLTVTDQQGCSIVGDVAVPDLSQFPPFELVAEVKPACNINGGRIALDVSAIQQPVDIQWSYEGDYEEVLFNINSGTYRVTVTDGNGCSAIGQYYVPSGPIVTAEVIPASCEGLNDGSITLSITGTNGNTIAWSDGSNQEAVRPNLPAGDYTVTITSPDGCSFEETYSTYPDGPTETYPYLESVRVTAQGPGIYEVIYLGEWIPTTAGCVVFSGGTQSISAALLQAMGNGTVSWIVESTFSEAVFEGILMYEVPGSGIQQSFIPNGVTVATSSISASDVQAITASGSIDFKLNFEASDSVGNEIIDMLSSSSNLNDCVTIPASDFATCTWLPPLNSIVIGADKTHRISFECIDARLVANTGGDAFCIELGEGFTPAMISAISWSVNGVPVGSGTECFNITNGEYGDYCATIKTFSGCVLKICETYCPPPEIGNITPTINGLTCAGDSDGSICLEIASPDESPLLLTLTWSNGTVGECISGLSAGSYSVTIDQANCAITPGYPEVRNFMIGLDNNQPLAYTFDLTPGCILDDTGSICVYATGGQAPYTFNWSNGEAGNCMSFSGPDCYRFVITDACGTVLEDCVEVEEIVTTPPGVAIIDDTDDCTGLILYVSGDFPIQSLSLTNVGDLEGTDILYTVTGEEGTFYFSGVPGGDYRIFSVDGCGNRYDLGVFSVDESAIPPVLTDIRYDYNCGKASLQIVAETNNYPVTITLIAQSTGLEYAGTTETGYLVIEGLPSGNYQWLIEDGCGFVYNAGMQSIEVPNTDVTIGNIATSYNCAAGFSFSILSGEAPFLVSLINGATGEIFTATGGAMDYVFENLAEGEYLLKIIDECQRAFSFGPYQVEDDIENESPTIGDIEISGSCGDNEMGVFNFTVSGGQPPFTFLIESDQNLFSSNVPSFSNLPPATYSLLITDACGEEWEYGEYIVPSYYVNYNHQIVHSCEGETDGIINLSYFNSNISDPDYSFSWSNGSNNEDIGNLAPGQYTVTISEANTGCSFINMFEVNAITIDLESYLVTGESLFINGNGFEDGTISITTSGAESFSYLWSNGDTGAMITGLSSGSYTVTVTAEGQYNCSNKFTFFVPLCDDGYPQSNIDYLATEVIQIQGENSGSINLAIEGQPGVSTHFVWTQSSTGLVVGNEEDLFEITEPGEYCVTIFNPCHADQEYCFEIVDECTVIDYSRFIDITIQNNCMDEEEGPSALIFEGFNDYITSPGTLLRLDWVVGTDAVPQVINSGVVEINCGGFSNPCPVIDVLGGTDRIEIEMLPNGVNPTSPNQVIWATTEFFEVRVYSYETGCYLGRAGGEFSNNNAREFLYAGTCRSVFALSPDFADSDELYYSEFYNCLTCGLETSGDDTVDRNCIDPQSLTVIFEPNEGDTGTFFENICQKGGRLIVDDDPIAVIEPNNSAVFFDDGDGGNCGCLFPPNTIEYTPAEIYFPSCYFEGAYLFVVAPGCEVVEGDIIDENTFISILPPIPECANCDGECGVEMSYPEGECPKYTWYCYDDPLGGGYPISGSITVGSSNFVCRASVCLLGGVGAVNYGVTPCLVQEDGEDCPNIAIYLEDNWAPDLPPCIPCLVEKLKQKVNALDEDCFQGTDENGLIANPTEIIGLTTKIVPNPTTNDFVAEINLSYSTILNVKIIDMLGNVIAKSETLEERGSTVLNFSFEDNVKSGIYFIRFETNEGDIDIKRIVLVR